MSEQKNDPLESKETPKNAPWEQVFFTQGQFLNDLECIGEMLSLVLPVLKRKDTERDSRIKELTQEVETETGKVRQLKSVQNIKEFLGHIQKKRQADRMFRQGIVTSIVSKFDEYLIMNLKVSYQRNPGWLKNPDKKITYKELLEIQSLEDLKGEIVQKEIESLMRDSHQAQIIFLDSRLKLGIEQGFPQWLDFLEMTAPIYQVMMKIGLSIFLMPMSVPSQIYSKNFIVSEAPLNLYSKVFPMKCL